jgi:hypothetical protein
MNGEKEFDRREEVLKEIERAESNQDLDELRRLYKILFKLMDQDKVE